jgi:hypothetical protein
MNERMRGASEQASIEPTDSRDADALASLLLGAAVVLARHGVDSPRLRELATRALESPVPTVRLCVAAAIAWLGDALAPIHALPDGSRQRVVTAAGGPETG